MTPGPVVASCWLCPLQPPEDTPPLAVAVVGSHAALADICRVVQSMHRPALILVTPDLAVSTAQRLGVKAPSEQDKQVRPCPEGMLGATVSSQGCRHAPSRTGTHPSLASSLPHPPSLPPSAPVAPPPSLTGHRLLPGHPGPGRAGHQAPRHHQRPQEPQRRRARPAHGGHYRRLRPRLRADRHRLAARRLPNHTAAGNATPDHRVALSRPRSFFSIVSVVRSRAEVAALLVRRPSCSSARLPATPMLR